MTNQEKHRLPRPAPCPSVEDMFALFAMVEEACERVERSTLSTMRPPGRVQTNVTQ